MPSRIEAVLFDEPSGSPMPLIMFSGAVLFVGVYAYGALRGGANSYLLVMAAGSTLSGIAESLPTDRRRIAGVLRITAILILLALVAVVLFAPDQVLA
ncbi:hypothetical protein GOC74_08925 [Halomicrobium mukohataei]|uniref:Uncharacterized protein n=1 Tax=Halomicrobium mukohataei TaxID=57705 RepID=A0A847UEX8_9EURY|nr:hypothetical protein [Halomicrobium mukohataei]NLV10050.1 hypothetical protein [Halomicrobium mukohataei]